ncbi:MAG: phosphoribosyl transferase [Parachlamydia sp.]|jgi:predicted phosphoribosyltransferase|nr:phosphoribosyl transferase [Parachlamydia sp.]
MFYENRQDAGKQLGIQLLRYKGQDVVVYGLPRGGVVVAGVIAALLNAPLDLVLAHKIGHPYQPEYAIAAVSESGHLILSEHEILDFEKGWFEKQKEREMGEIKRKRNLYLKGREEMPIEGKTALLVDDGIATGFTIRAAIEELKGRKPKEIIVAVPVAPKRTAELIMQSVDGWVGNIIPDGKFFGAVGAYYINFDQTSDEEVIQILNKCRDGNAPTN